MYKNTQLLSLFLLLFITNVNAQHWQNVTPSGYTYFSTASFINKNEGWVVARNGDWDNYDLLHTTDGAISFVPVFSFPDNLVSWRLQMVDSLNGFALVDPISGYGKCFWTTHDGGYSWIDITDTTMFKPGGPFNYSHAYYFLNRNTGFAGGTNAIFRTIDAGTTWSKMITPEVIDSTSSNYYSPNDIFFYNETYGWAANSLFYDNGFVLKTIDGGQTWTTCEPITGDLYKIHFADSLHGGTVGYSVLGTNNNFNSIAYYYAISDWHQFPSSICYQNDSTIWVSGYPAIIYKSEDAGEIFVEYDTTYATENMTDQIYDFQFYGNTGYAFSYSFMLKYVDTLNTSIYEANVEDNTINISPNPVSDKCKVTVSAQKPEQAGIELYAINGELVFRVEKNLIAGKNEIVLDIENLKPGLYILNITTSTGISSMKIIKQP
jgi:hypothetical protein